LERGNYRVKKKNKENSNKGESWGVTPPRHKKFKFWGKKRRKKKKFSKCGDNLSDEVKTENSKKWERCATNNTYVVVGKSALY